MTATSRTPVLQFGPEWMRPKHAKNPPSPPPTTGTHAPPGSSSYSSLVAPAPQTPQATIDVDNPFKYSKEDMVRIYKEGGGRGGLGLEVERWECVREVSYEPVSTKPMTEAEKKLFAGPLNSEVRRRQSSDFNSPLVTPSGERPKLMHNPSGASSPLRDRFNNALARRNTGSDQPALTLPRKLSLSSLQAGALGSPRGEAGQSSPRVRGPATPGSGFDGVLNGGDSWTSRRRASEGISKGPGGTRGEGDTEGVAQQPINEAEEDSGGAQWNGVDAQDGGPRAADAAPDPTPANNEPSTGGGMIDSSSGVNGVQQQAPQNTQPAIGDMSYVPSAPPNAGPPPGLPDVASIEWSYLDPQGNIQGPFRADIMQKWFEEGYFAPDLLMKRTTMDTEWTTVGDLAVRANGEKLFLSHFNSLPPGLSRRMDPPFESIAPQAGGMNGAHMSQSPYQPIPTRSMHPSFDTFYVPETAASNSPSSSFGAARFVNDSPDPMAFAGGRMINQMHPMSDSPVGSRQGSLMAEPTSGFVNRRQGFNEPAYDPAFGGRALGNIGPARTSSVDSYGMGSQGGWPPANAVHPGYIARNGSVDSAGPFSPNIAGSMGTQSPLTREFGNVRAPQDGLVGGYGSIGGPGSQSTIGSAGVYPSEDRQNTFGTVGQDSYASGLPSSSPFVSSAQSQQYTQSPSVQYASPSVSSAQPALNQSQQVPSPSPWKTIEESVPKRTGMKPFDPEIIPTSRNTVSTRVVGSPQPSSISRSQPASAAKEQAPWYASHSAAADSWSSAQGPNSLTVSNLGQHNQQQEQEAAQQAAERREEQPSVASKKDSTPAATAAAETTTLAQAPAPTPKTSRKAPASPAIPKATPAVTTTTQPVKAPSPSPAPSPAAAAPAKPVWSTEDDKKKTPGAPMSLREIQEAEAKKQEARKAAERERARAAAAAQASSQEETAPFTTSWGLPTSQAGKTQSSSVAKDTTVSASSSSGTVAPSAASAAVWTNSPKALPAKKTMKEIQEEEEKRKKMAAKETAAATAARRAYAETTTKAPAPGPALGGAWSTVGANGKAVGAASTPTATRPAIAPSQPSVASVAAARTPSTASTAARMPSAASVVKVSTPAPQDETPPAPSLDFMRWLNDSLKGLKTSANSEEIMSVLLSFPLDVDADTFEIIAETIYASSNTLDGRRFAQDFVSRRKADAASRKGSATTGKQSIADVVKLQPKSNQQSEWGGFKVVNKKKKGGKA